MNKPTDKLIQVGKNLSWMLRCFNKRKSCASKSIKKYFLGKISKRATFPKIESSLFLGFFLAFSLAFFLAFFPFFLLFLFFSFFSFFAFFCFFSFFLLFLLFFCFFLLFFFFRFFFLFFSFFSFYSLRIFWRMRCLRTFYIRAARTWNASITCIFAVQILSAHTLKSLIFTKARLTV